VRPTTAQRETRFKEVYAAHYEPILRFARRRTDPASADDIVAETFLVAWRRLDAVPVAPGQALPWLYAVARRCLLNAARSQHRQDAVAVRLCAQPAGMPGRDPAAESGLDEVAARVDLAAAWQRLGAGEQEVLSLALFEDLTSAQGARVLGISSAAYRLRLSRARRALRGHLLAPARGHVTAAGTPTAGPRAAAAPPAPRLESPTDHPTLQESTP